MEKELKDILKKIPVKVDPKYKTGEKHYLFADNDSALMKFFNWFKYLPYRLKMAYYETTESFRSLYRWRKMAWRDRTWGDANIIDVLAFKIEMDCAAIKRRDISWDTTQRVETMSRVVELLKRYNEDDYSTPLRAIHDAKWGPDEHYTMELMNGNHEWLSERDDRLTAEQIEEEKPDFRTYTTLAEQQRHADLTEALEIIKNNLTSWWD